MSGVYPGRYSTGIYSRVYLSLYPPGHIYQGVLLLLRTMGGMLGMLHPRTMGGMLGR